MDRHEWIDMAHTRLCQIQASVNNGDLPIPGKLAFVFDGIRDLLFEYRSEFKDESSQVQSLTLEVEWLRGLLRGVIAEADRETNAFIEARNALQGSVGETVCEECDEGWVAKDYEEAGIYIERCPKCQGDSQ